MILVDKGALRIFRAFGVDVFVHWSWAVVALVEVQLRTRQYHSQAWNACEYLALFAIVLLHEFGHALACRSVGGTAQRIVLWPLGGVAYVRPPARPWPVLWSIAAGPLVNLVLLPLLASAAWAAGFTKIYRGDLAVLLGSLAAIDVGLLLYNLLPFYPLDGGQILHALLWRFIGRARALRAAALVGVVGATLIAGGAIYLRSPWLGALALFGGFRAFAGLRQAEQLLRLERAEKRDAACPNCGEAPPVGELWRCGCGSEVDSFASDACPRCRHPFDRVACPSCHALSPRERWATSTSGASGDPPPAA